MVSYNKNKRKKSLKRRVYMLNDEICELREKPNESIIKGQDYSVTYKLSIELDELIAKYYRKTQKAKENSCILIK